jgi:hypothetical protein
LDRIGHDTAAPDKYLLLAQPTKVALNHSANNFNPNQILQCRAEKMFVVGTCNPPVVGRKFSLSQTEFLSFG